MLKTFPNVRNLVDIAKDMNKLNLTVFQRSQEYFTSEEADYYKNCINEISKRFYNILVIIQQHAKETLQDLSLTMEEIEHDKYESEVMWSAIEFKTNNFDDYFNTKHYDKFDIADLAHLFHNNKVPEEVEHVFIEMIDFTDDIGIPNGNAKVTANINGAFYEYTPVIIEPVLE